MKKIFVFMMAMLLAAPVVYAQNNKALEKARAKEYKTKMKEYKKEGWKIFGSSRSIDVSLLTHYDKLNKLGEKGYELVGICAKYKSDNVGYQVAANNAATMYARTAGSTLKGRLVSDLLSLTISMQPTKVWWKRKSRESCVSPMPFIKTLAMAKKPCRFSISSTKRLPQMLAFVHTTML